MNEFRGQNIVELQGEVIKPYYGSTHSGFNYFKFKMSVPIVYKHGNLETITRKNYVPCIAWGDMAKSLKEHVREHMWLKVIGHIQEKSYIGECSACGSRSRVFYTEVLITNYFIVGEVS